jgi:hypothetical protein
MRSDNFKIILEILGAIEKQMDDEATDWSLFSDAALGVSQPRWLKIMAMLNDEGLIKGFSYTRLSSQVQLDIKNVRLTLSGLNYIRDKGQ